MSQLSNPSQLLERNFQLFSDVPTLLVEAAADLLLRRWQQHFDAPLSLFSTDYLCHRQHLALGAGAQAQFGHRIPQPAAPYQQAVMIWPKSKALAHYLLTQIAAVLAPGAPLWLVGDNRGGIRSGIKQLPDGLASAVKQDAARRCSLFCSELLAPQPYPDDTDAQHWFKLEIAGTKMHVCSYPGVFSHGELDPGTRLLLEQPLAGEPRRLLDIGCGAGIIAGYYGLQTAATALTLCDVNAMALAASRQTLAANGLSGTVLASDVFTDVSERYDLIISNPPFHQGLDTNYDITRRLVEGAPQHLLPAGALRIVANSFLKYPEILAKHFPAPKTLVDDRRFRVYHAQS